MLLIDGAKETISSAMIEPGSVIVYGTWISNYTPSILWVLGTYSYTRELLQATKPSWLIWLDELVFYSDNFVRPLANRLGGIVLNYCSLSSSCKKYEHYQCFIWYDWYVFFNMLSHRESEYWAQLKNLILVGHPLTNCSNSIPFIRTVIALHCTSDWQQIHQFCICRGRLYSSAGTCQNKPHRLWSQTKGTTTCLFENNHG